MINKFLQFLGLTKKAGKLTEGYNNCEDALKRGKVKLIVLSKDVSNNTRDKFHTYHNRFDIAIIEAYTKAELGAALGRAEINVLCVTDDKMSKKLIDLWNEEEKLIGGE